MLLIPIVYYGKQGLESDIFESYMRRSGHDVRVVSVENGSLPQVANPPGSIAVISTDKSQSQISRFVQQLIEQTEDCVKIFLLGDSLPEDSAIPSVEVIPRPRHLEAVVRRIQTLSHTGE